MKAMVFYNKEEAGVLEKKDTGYLFSYLPAYINIGGRPISITMPLKKKIYESDKLFPIFINMLSEGSNKKMQCRLLKIAEDDYFNLLLRTATTETIGPITVEPINE
jgi:HipA-like protein